MRGIASILAGTFAALLLTAGLFILGENGGPFAADPSIGAAIAVATVAAFLFTNDLLKRETRDATQKKEAWPSLKAPVQPLFDPLEPVYIEAVTRDWIEHMNRALATAGKNGLAVLRITLSPRGKYERDSLRYQLHVFDQFGGERAFVYVVKPGGAFVSLARAKDLVRLLDHAEDGPSLVHLLNAGLDSALKDLPGMETFCISRKTSTGEALRLLVEHRASAAMIVHETRGTPIGPIDWYALIDRVLPKARGPGASVISRSTPEW